MRKAAFSLIALGFLILFSPAGRAQPLNLSNGIHTYDTLENRTVTLTGRAELHVTGRGNPIRDCQIHLNSPDAWLFLENVRPAAVFAGPLAQIRVNGQPAASGVNVRVAEYAMGTVILPHPPTVTPMEVWDAPQFLGRSMPLGLYTYYNDTNLGAMKGAIASFKLKRGYMATIAQRSDGGGLSRVYVAQDGDITVSALPAEWKGAIAYIRIFPWQWIGKKGWCGGDPEYLVDPLWWYNWGDTSVSFPNIEFVPMKWDEQESNFLNINGKQSATHLLAYNEPNGRDQADMTPDLAIAEWPKLLQSGLRLGSPAPTDGGAGWLFEFMDKADAKNYRVDYVAVHFYRCGNSAEQLRNWLRGIHERTGRPIWITEWNNGANWTSCPDPTLEENARVIASWLDMFERTPWIERYSVYNWVEDVRAMTLDGAITPAGVVYRDHPSRVAFNQELPAGGGAEARYSFSGDALDSSGNGNDGMLIGSPGFAPGRSGGAAIALDGARDYVLLPAGVGNSAEFSFAAWVNWKGGAGFQRIFDLGAGEHRYLFLTPSSDAKTLRFAITSGGNAAEQRLESRPLTPGVWTHVAVTIRDSVGKLYVNGALVATNAKMTIRPDGVKTKYNYLGKSQFPPDPLFAGKLQNVAFAGRALTDSEVAALAKAAPAGTRPLSLLAAHTEVSASKPLTLTPQNGTWDLSRHDSLFVRLRNPNPERVTVWARAENPGAKGVTDNVRTALTLEPGKSATLRLRLMRRPEDPTYAPFKPFFMYYKDINVRDNTVDPAAIARLVVWLDPSAAGQNVDVEAVTAQGAGVPAPVPFFPFVDKYGQYKHTDWPDKIYSDADFAAVRKKDQAEMDAYPGPEDWDKWGGWKNGPRQKATGFFYPAKVDDKWWLVDPDGSLFWSYGATGVGSGGEGSPVTDKERWFEELPAPNGPFGEYWGEGKGARFMYYQDGKPWRSFSFSGANAERKYGPRWREATANALHARLRNWGLNTIANWSDPVVYLKHKTPYTVPLTSGAWSLDHFPDVFDPAWERSVNAAMDAQKNTTANDPWNIGYFVDNELTWGAQPNAIRAVQGVLRAPQTSPGKQRFVGDLRAKYTDITGLNAAWGTAYASWDALLESQALPEPRNARFNDDAGNFGAKMAEKYFQTVRDAVKRVAPNNLYLGCRFHGHIDPSLIRIAAKYVDVISYNVYELPNGRLNQYRGVVDKPFLVGEFGVTSDLGQMPWRGQIYTEEQGARLRPLENYLAQAFVHPALVGAHFFQFRDQPLTGRADGEATLRGFLNVADTPHFDLVQINRRYAYNLYATRSTGRLPSPWTGQPIRGMVGVGTWATQAEFKDIKVTRGDQTLFASDFSKGLQGWKTIGGKWEVVDGALRQTGNEPNARALIGQGNWSDYTLTLKARKIEGAEGFLIFFGLPTEDTRSYLNLGGWGNTQHGLEVPGIDLVQIPGKIETGRWYEIKIEVQGPAVKAYLDGQLVQQARR